MASVLVLGALHLDVIVDAPRLPARDETLMGSAVAYRFGGKGGNQAVAAARFGADVAMAGAVGEDRFGEMILAELAARGVDDSQVARLDGASGMSVAIVEDGGDYGAVVVSGVNRQVDGEAVAVGDASVCVMQNEIPEAANLALARRLPDGCRLILNAAPAREVDPGLLGRVDILVVNRVEAAQMAGLGPSASPVAALERLMAGAMGEVIVTCGADGVFGGASDGGVWQTAAYPAQAISTHGAGDCFVGAIAARLAAGDALRDAVEFGMAAAALHVGTDVDQRDRIGVAEVQALMARRP